MGTSSKKNITSNDILRLLCDEQWSNAVCCGYLILACENIGYDEDEIKILLNSMHDTFNVKTINQAKQKYINY